MQIEHDTVKILSGIKSKKTLGSPVALMIKNKDFKINELPQITEPRPGHADLAGCLKYGFKDARCVLERASARETAARTAVGAVCKLFLEQFKIEIKSSLLCIGGEFEQSSINKKIQEAKQNRDTLGGMFMVRADGLPVGLGTYVHYDRRLDGRIAGAVMSIPAIKSVEFGMGLAYCLSFGSKVHDAIFYSKKKGYYRNSNNAGGLEGGVTNGEPLIVRACMKPISTIGNPLASINLSTKKPSKAAIERYDTCAVEAAGVVAEAVIAFEIAGAFIEKFGADSLEETKDNYLRYLKKVAK